MNAAEQEDQFSLTASGRETANKWYWKTLKQYVKENRGNQTEAEQLIWHRLRGKKIDHKVRRQHAIGFFIADFVCLNKRVVIEIDGPIHSQNVEYDRARTAALNCVGFKVIRFSNDEVTSDIESVILRIKSILDSERSIS